MTTVVLRKTELGEGPLAESFRQIFVRSQSVVSRQVAGETLIVPVRGKVGDLASIYSFNQTGSLIWKLLETPRDLAELVAAVEQEYDVNPEQARNDVAQFLSDMLSTGLVEIVEPRVPAIEPVGRTGLEAAGAR